MYRHILLCGVYGVCMEWTVHTPLPALVMAVAHQCGTFPTWSSINSSSSHSPFFDLLDTTHLYFKSKICVLFAVVS